jgi:hypothetical protein
MHVPDEFACFFCDFGPGGSELVFVAAISCIIAL